jgi:hypothetical protein
VIEFFTVYTTNMKHLTILLALTVLMSWSCAQAQIALEFDWPDGLQATVTHTKSKTREGTPSSLPSGVTVVYDIDARKTPEGIVVSQSNVRIDTSALPTAFSDVERKQLQILTQAALPTFLVSPTGKFERLVDAAAFRATLLSAFHQALPSLINDQKLNELLIQMTSDASLSAMASADWAQTVGFWAGGRLDVGEYYETESQSAIPFFPQKSFKMKSRIKVVGKVECSRMGQERGCVEIEMETRPDSDEIASVLEELIQQTSALPTTSSSEVIDSINLIVKTRLVTEPNGLIPHRYSTSKRIQVSGRTGAIRKTVSELQDVSMIYTYRTGVP